MLQQAPGMALCVQKALGMALCSSDSRSYLLDVDV